MKQLGDGLANNQILQYSAKYTKMHEAGKKIGAGG